MEKLRDFKILHSILMALVSALLALNFVFYTSAERRIDQSYEARHQFHLLADELKTSSDDLTRMVRTYAVTRNSKYGEFYRKILDTREGRSERPSHQDQLYWHFVTDPDQRVQIQLIAPHSLLSRMRNVGLQNEELRLLEDALMRSNHLAAMEWKAIDLLDVDKKEEGNEVALSKMLMELHGDEYHRQKAQIMGAIHQFYLMVDKRLHRELEAQKNHTFLLRNSLILLILVLMALVFNMRIKEIKMHRDETKASQHLLHQQNAILAIVSHDLRNPIAAIKAHLEILKESAVELTDRSKKIIHLMTTSTNTLLYLLNDLLTFTDIESPHFTLNKELTSINAMIVEQVTLNLPESKRKNIELLFESNVDIHAKIDIGRINQVLSNLLSNALKYSPSYTQIFIGLERNGNHLTITIQDQGPGIPPHELHGLFMPFKTLSAPPTGGETKTGLGLFISKKIVEAHKGKISVSSPSKGGCRFSLTLPLDDK